jgi:electron transfer flavoprotein alpha subunit
MATSGGGVLIAGEVAANGALRPVSFEMISAGRALAEGIGQPLIGLLMGSGVADQARVFGDAGVDRLLVADDPRLAGLVSEAAATMLTAAIGQTSPAVVLVPGTTAGCDYAPRTAARLGVGLAADCVSLWHDGEALVATRPVLGGRAQSEVRLAGAPAMATVRVGSYAKAVPAGGGPVAEPLAVEMGAAETRVSVVATVAKGTGPTSLESAAVVVSGGRGLKEAAKFTLVEELADALGGAVGATRAVVDAGWRPHHEQIGQTGRTVSPRLYVAVGISGAVQHNVGMQGSEHIVAINRDPDAPIFKLTSFGIVGDLFEVVPALTAELRRGKDGG